MPHHYFHITTRRHLEQHLNGIRLSGLGVATMLNKPTWEGLLIAQAQAYTLTQNAKAKAETLADWNQNRIEVIVQTCRKLLDK